MDPRMMERGEAMEEDVDPGVADEAKLSVLDDIHALMDQLEEKGLEVAVRKKKGGEEKPPPKSEPKPEASASGDEDLAKLAAISRE